MAMTRRQFLAQTLTVVSAAGAGSALCQPLPAAPGRSPDPGRRVRLAQIHKDQGTPLNALLEPIRKAHDLPALAGAAVVDGRTVALGAVGYRKHGSDVMVTVDDQFHLGSCTKAMTATLIGMLIEQGKLDWNTTLAQARPDLAPTLHAAFKNVTVEMLLAHRGGFSDRGWPLGKTIMDMHQLPGTPRAQRQSYVQAMLAEQPDYAPGTKFVYSNTSYAVLGSIVEHLTDMAWEDFITKRLFEPLGMKSTGFGAMGTAEKMDQPWQHLMLNGKPQPIEPGPRSDNPPVIAPAGTVHCSIGDWAQFVIAHVLEGQGAKPLLKPATFQHLHTPWFGGEYAGGWIVTQRDWGGGRVLNHAGSNNLNYAVAWMAPLKKFAVLVTTNQGGDGAAAACDEVATAIIQRYL